MIKYSSRHKLVLRIFASIPFLAVILISAIIGSIRTWIMFLRFGGEYITYNQDDFATIDKIYNQLKQNDK